MIWRVQEAVAAAGYRVALGSDEGAVDLGPGPVLEQGAVEVKAGIVQLGGRLPGQGDAVVACLGGEGGQVNGGGLLLGAGVLFFMREGNF